jgi:hypothetical protein
MTFSRLLLFFVFSYNFISSQTTVYRDTIPVYDSNGKLLSPWAGGLNFSSFTQIDLNSDGKKDIVAYDKICGSGGKLRAFLNVGGVNEAKYLHAFNYQNQFPNVSEWALFFDYNNDGRADLFTYTTGGIKVYKNTSIGQNLSFSLSKSMLLSNYNPAGPPSITNLYCNAVALPGIADIDNDGDLDILSYSVFGVKIEFHKNMSQELYGTSDSLVFNMVDDCWGDIKENNCSVDLNQCPYMKAYSSLNLDSLNKPLHSGSCIMCFDRNGDGDLDLLLGDISCSDVFFVENEGLSTNAHIGDTTKLFPNYPNKGGSDIIKLNSFPCTYYLDVDNDGFKDLVASPNATAGSENYQSVWLYKNTSATPTVNFVFQKKNFLQEDMIELGEGAYPVLFDADLDGKKDLIIGNLGYYVTNTNKSKLAFYKNIGSLTAPSFSLVTKDYQALSGFNIYSMAPTFGDLDNDGDLDLIIGDNIGQLHYFENTAAVNQPAQFNSHVSFYKSIDVGNSAYPQLVDVNKDGLIDLVIGSQNGKLSYYKNTGTLSSPNFSLQTNFFGEVDVRQTSIGSITGYSMPFLFNDANSLKLLVGSEIGNVYLYDNIDGNLSGVFNRVDTALFKINEGPRCAPYFEDITNDGKRDLFLGNYAGGLAFFNSTNASGVGVKELIDDSFVKIFPNPTSDFINVVFDNDFITEMSIELFDVLGNKLTEEITYNKQKKLSISGLCSGIYFLKIHEKSSTKFLVKKIIIQ